jgi:hypothetical protein
LRFLVRLLPHAPAGETFLSTIRSLARSVGADPRNPKWTSYGALELDVFSRTEEDFAVFLSVVEPLASLEFSRDLNRPPPFLPKDRLVAEARKYFNAERYWECHEVLESVWRNVTGDEKLFVQGVILVCAALVHHQKGEDTVALSVLKRATRQLRWEHDAYYGINVRALQENVAKMLASGRLSVFNI